MKVLTFALAVTAGAVIASPALADRQPTTKERAAVERVLKANNFIGWEEIELDDEGPDRANAGPVWEVDGARTRDQREGKWDITIDPRTMKIINRERDD